MNTRQGTAMASDTSDGIPAMNCAEVYSDTSKVRVMWTQVFPEYMMCTLDIFRAMKQ